VFFGTRDGLEVGHRTLGAQHEVRDIADPARRDFQAHPANIQSDIACIIIQQH
jgi:hypothetical protein